MNVKTSLTLLSSFSNIWPTQCGCGKQVLLLDDKGHPVGPRGYLVYRDQLHVGAEIETSLFKVQLQEQIIGEDYEASLKQSQIMPMACQVDVTEKGTTFVSKRPLSSQKRF